MGSLGNSAGNFVCRRCDNKAVVITNLNWVVEWLVREVSTVDGNESTSIGRSLKWGD